MAKNFRVGDKFRFNGKLPNWWVKATDRTIEDSPWRRFKGGEILRVTQVVPPDHVLIDGVHFYREQLLPVMKLRRKV